MTSPTCLVCFDDLEKGNECYYLYKEIWYRSAFCNYCIEYIRTTQYDSFIKQFSNSTCAKEQRTLLDRGPPVAVHDRLGFPETNGNEIEGLKLNGSSLEDTDLPHILEGSKTGNDRQVVLDWMYSFIIQNEELSDDDKNKNEDKPNKEGFQDE